MQPRLAYPGFGTDAYPGSTPQMQNDQERASWSERWYHDEPQEPGSGTYNFFYGAGQLHVSPTHEHDELRDHAGVQQDHTGPMAVGTVRVERGRATWSVGGNVSIRGLYRVFKDYTKQVGWQWGGLTDLDGDPINDDFSPKKSMKIKDNETGVIYGWTKQGKTAWINDDLPLDARQMLMKKGYRLAEYPGGSNMNDLMVNSAPMGEDLEIYNRGTNDDRREPSQQDEAPTGTFRCPECGQIFNRWNEYLLHRKHELPESEDEPESKFPDLPDYDKAIPNSWHPRQPFVMPLASVKDAERYEEFEEYADFLGLREGGIQHYGAFRDGECVGIASVETNRTRTASHIRYFGARTVLDRASLLVALQTHFARLALDVEDDAAERVGFVKAAKGYRWSAGNEPKDQIDRPIPFIYDVQDDRIVIGHPGSRHADIPGKFTPGGIVEGEYLPGGKVHIHTMTNVPYTVRHFADLWYWSYPQMQITGVELHDSQGNKQRLATRHIPVLDYDSMGRSEGNTRAFLVGPDAIHLGGPGSTHDDLHQASGNDAYDFDPGWITPGGEVGFMSSLGDELEHRIVHSLRTHTGEDLRPFGGEWHFGSDSAKLSKVDVGHYIKQLAATDPAVWQSFQALRKEGGQVYVVGGAVRDALLGKQPKDIDLMVTGIPSEKVHQILAGLPGRVDLTGKDFGVYRYRNRGHEVEIALPRTERSTGDRRVDFDVQVDHNLPVEEDLLRRDFTVNAMAVSLEDGSLVDPYHGTKDIDERRLRTVHPSSFEEDPTRLLRGLVASSRHGLHPDEQTRAEMVANAHRLDGEARERVQAELDKLFASARPAEALRLAHDTGILKHIFPELAHNFDYDQRNPHHNYSLGEHHLQAVENMTHLTNDPDMRLLAALHDVGKPESRSTKCHDCGEYTNDHDAEHCPNCGSTNLIGHYFEGPGGQGKDHALVGADMIEARLRALKYPVARIKRIRHLDEHHMFPAFSSAKGARKFVHRVGDEHADDLLNFRWADQHGKGQTPAEIQERTPVDTMRGLVEQVRSSQAPTSQSALAINGNDIMALGVKPGPQIGRILRQLTDDVIEDPSLNDPNVLKQRAQEYIDAF